MVNVRNKINPIDLKAIADRVPGPADVAIILGSGLGGFAERLTEAKSVSTADLPGYPVSTVAGHKGRIVVGSIGKTRVMAFQGRVHLYEGYSPEQVVLPVRLAYQVGVRTLIVTNASGSFTKRFGPGDLLLIDDHINLQFRNPLHGAVREHEVRWPDMCKSYDPQLMELAESVAIKLKIKLKRGTLGAVLGPSYETPAEVKMLARIGADAGCMSTIPEVITAASLGMKVLGISCVTNYASGMIDQKLSHEDVQKTASAASDKFAKLLTGIIERLTEEDTV